jgi:hypothetical protein
MILMRMDAGFGGGIRLRAMGRFAGKDYIVVSTDSTGFYPEELFQKV